MAVEQQGLLPDGELVSWGETLENGLFMYTRSFFSHKAFLSLADEENKEAVKLMKHTLFYMGLERGEEDAVGGSVSVGGGRCP